jgi:hypothetical protein
MKPQPRQWTGRRERTMSGKQDIACSVSHVCTGTSPVCRPLAGALTSPIGGTSASSGVLLVDDLPHSVCRGHVCQP